MRISLSEIMNLNGESREIVADIEMQRFEGPVGTFDIKHKAPVSIKAHSVNSKSVMLEAVIDIILEGMCDRCLEPVDIPFHIEFSRRYDFDDDGNAHIAGDEDDEEVYYISGYDLDVDELVSEEVTIGFPMKVLCDEACKGICKVCGANLNKGECGCDRTELDPRMSVIRDLFRQKEV